MLFFLYLNKHLKYKNKLLLDEYTISIQWTNQRLY